MRVIIRIQTWSKFSFFRRRWWFGKWPSWINCIPIIWCATLAFLITFWRFLITCWHFFITFWCWRFTPRHWQWRNLRIIIFPPNIFGKFSSIIIWINITGYSFSEYIFFQPNILNEVHMKVILTKNPYFYHYYLPYKVSICENV